ncbi:hypothetical protein ACYSNM_10005 [Myroides sp. LJL116]
MRKKNLVWLFLLSAILVFGQSGINISNVNPLAALHIDALLGDQGVLIPRLTTSERDSIVIDEQTEDGLTIFNTDEGCINFWSKTTKSWKSVCGELGFSEFTILEPLVVFGLYKSKISVDESHFVQFKVKVDKPGSYELIATSENDNGYSYLIEGDFPTTGIFNIQMPAQGTPINPTTVNNLDKFTIFINGKANNGGAPAAKFEVEVVDSSKKPAYKILCSSASVHGLYYYNVPVNSSNYIEVSLEVDSSINNVLGATYEFTSDTIDGLSFYGTGRITANTMRVRLYASGTPTSSANKIITLKSNSETSNTTCRVEVLMTIPKKTMLSIGSSANGYGYNFAGTAASNRLVTSQINYGNLPDSKVAFEGWEAIINGGNDPSVASLRNWLNGARPVDIVVIGYSWTMREEHAILLAEYLKKGGVILAFTEANTGSSWLLKHVFGQNNIGVVNGSRSGATYSISGLSDPVLLGPFADIREKHWGEDASTSNIAVGIDPTQIYIYSNQYDTQRDEGQNNNFKRGATAFRHRTLNFIWVGDGGFNSHSQGNTSNTITPFVLKSDGSPDVKNNYGHASSSRRVSVYNAYFTANAMAWALRQTEVNGINKGKL